MLDCGCNEEVDKGMLDIVSKEASKCHFILLSHSTYQHLGALPYHYKVVHQDDYQNGIADNSSPITQKIIATSPVVKMGAQTMNELCIQLKENPVVEKGSDGAVSGYREFDLFDL